MNFTVIREHREFFRKHHWIECDGVLSSDELKRLSEGIPAVLMDRSTEIKSPSLVIKAFDKQNFGIGRDIWRGAAPLKKIILSRSLAGIVGELTEQKPLRFGYDTLFPAVAQNPTRDSYASFLQTTPTLEEMSCIQGVLCGAMICLSNEGLSVEGGATTTLFSNKPGNAVFFAPNWPLPFNEIYQHPGCSYLLLVYVKTNAVYLAQQGDPHLHHFKRLGYSFGDRLKESFHPIVYS